MEADGVPNIPPRDPDDDLVEDDDIYVMYKDRSEWSDIHQVAQDEGEEPVVQIEYSAKCKSLILDF